MSQTYSSPSCQWSFNRARDFHHVSGDSAAVFHQNAAELTRRHVSNIDDAQGTWAARLDRIFRGHADAERSDAHGPEGAFALFHLPVSGPDGSVLYVAGFAFPAQAPLPPAAELALAAVAALAVVQSERARATRFLHDVVAQSLSGAGLQLELLQLEIHALSAELFQRALEIQKSLDEVLKRIRDFSDPD